MVTMSYHQNPIQIAAPETETHSESQVIANLPILKNI